MENDKNKADQSESQNKQSVEQSSENTKSDNDTYKKTMMGTGVEKSDENFDGTYQQTDEKNLDDRDNNDGDANTENNY